MILDKKTVLPVSQSEIISRNGKTGEDPDAVNLAIQAIKIIFRELCEVF